MRIVSMLPAATEIVAALDMLPALVGVSHECDHPPEVRDLPRITRCEIHGNGLPSAETDRWVRETLAARGTLYTMDEDTLRRLRPDVIVTQELCDVCAVDFASVERFAATLPGPPVVVSLAPRTLADVFGDVLRVATAIGVPDRGAAVVAALEARVAAVRRRTERLPRRRCVLLEWIDPPFRSGHWGPDLVEIAGGHDRVGRAGEDAVRVDWEVVRAAEPEVLVLACCGYDVCRTLEDLPLLQALPGYASLPAVRSGEVWVLDGSIHVSRPGPRLVESLELLGRLLHPEQDAPAAPPAGVLRVPA